MLTCHAALWHPIERVREKELLFGVTTDQVGRLIAHVGDDRVAESFYLDAHRRLEIDSRNKMSAVRRHKKLRIVSKANRAQISLGSGPLRFGAAGYEKDNDICRSGNTKNFQGWHDGWIAPQLVPRCPAPRSGGSEISRTGNWPPEIIAHDNLPIR